MVTEPDAAFDLLRFRLRQVRDASTHTLAHSIPEAAVAGEIVIAWKRFPAYP